MKTCRKGHGEFSDDLRMCPVCQKEYRHKHYEEHKEEERVKTLEWRSNNRDHVLDYGKKYWEENKDKGKKHYATRLAKRKYDNVWRGMHGRCYNPKHHKFPTYGARGITVCPEWHGEEGYFRFEAHMGERPSPLYSIDRIDNNGNYEPGNVHWATKKQQQRNRSVNKLLTIDGRTQCIAAWAEEVGIGFSAFKGRMAAGWKGEELLRPNSQPDQKRKRQLNTLKKKEVNS